MASRRLAAIGLSILLVLPALAGPPGAWAGPPASLDEALSGFEDAPSKKEEAPVDLDRALGGFDQAPAQAEEKGDLEDALKGFGDEADAVSQASPRLIKKPDWLDWKGSLSLAGAVNFTHQAPEEGRIDQRGLSKLRTEADLEANFKLPDSWRARLSGHAFYDWAYTLRGRGDYPDDFLEIYEREAELDEVWLQGRLLPSLDLKIGRQIVVWGKSDNIRVTDVLNPLDNRLPGLTDIEDLRLPAAMTKLDCYFGDWNLSGIVVHEVRQPKTPVLGSDFYPAAYPLPSQDKPSVGLDNQEYALALNGVFTGWDLSLYAASIFDDQAHLELTPKGLKRRQSRLTMAGLALAVARGNWLIKAEAAWLSGLEFSARPGREKSRLDLLFGLEYSGFNETTISLEAANRHLFDYEDELAGGMEDAREDDFQWALRLSRDFLHDRLTLTLVAAVFDLLGSGGAFERLQLDFDLTDHLGLTVGLLTYQSGEKLFLRDAAECDRVFFEVKYSF